jgi:hypothetical protein
LNFLLDFALARRAVIGLGCIFLAGCGMGAGRAQVTGSVTLDGTPVKDAVVTFAPQAGGQPATGVSDAAGKFTLQTRQPGDGVELGLHDVTITGVKTSGGPPPTADGLSGAADMRQMKQEWFIPQRYSVRETARLTQEVTRGMPPVELKLTRAPRSAAGD